MENESADVRHLSERDAGITRREYAALARVHPDTIKRWARVGIGPKPRRVGPRLLRYDREEVLAYLQISGTEVSAS
ncbi:helix-turn-helix transcriptional regulator [Streptomyces cyaneochromogenes]|uniref:helix-turn-helix transcriptional regulator n=1 Tax=Streptomyces cyaneochromogenes TaxID=2496836 RepID=UPI001E5D4068|nr:DNA-binding protein [Streptomyces cyaneochromogenes]